MVAPTLLRDTLRSLGYIVRDPRKVRSFVEEEHELRHHRHQLLITASVMLASLGFMGVMWLGVRQPWFKWMMLALALGMVFGAGWPILKMAWASHKRGILNQHMFKEFGAFGGLLGGAVFPSNQDRGVRRPGRSRRFSAEDTKGISMLYGSTGWARRRTARNTIFHGSTASRQRPIRSGGSARNGIVCWS